MNLNTPLLRGHLIRRYKRFLMDLQLEDGSELTVHCANTGSMEGCLEPEALVLASLAKNPKRKLSHTAEWIQLSSGWVGINTHRSNGLVEEALGQRRIPELSAYTQIKREVPYGQGSRIDLLLSGEGLPDCYVEVKNTTWPTPDGGVGFPDSPTERGRKHLRELMEVARHGDRAVCFFLVNREDGEFFRPAHERDPDFAHTLCAAHRAGVELLAYKVNLDPPSVSIGARIECRLEKCP